ncbi:hypothetical protein [Litoreibacter roseus]|uniref:TRAP-type mannitol/chloroaromatic compound transport system, substrate-binding protein n=1 Tax=Litoreibacter roseus TaxID=2601869 RepID=A0A6N6JLS7_9RHOB|nr:hypothetical protein [Litoreibacter roseus]GFE66359.1 hypothetical protein KIN_34330 [Litoreibacter roseus]
MKRRSILSGLAVGAGLGVATPMMAQTARVLRLITDLPDDGARLADRFALVTDGRIQLEITVVEPSSAVDLRKIVSNGSQDMYLSSEGNFIAEEPALALFAAMPNGMAPNELEAWVYTAGGADVWNSFGLDSKIKNYLAGDTGPMPIWSREPISTVEGVGGPIASVGSGLKLLEKLGVPSMSLMNTDDVTSAFGVEGIPAYEMVKRGLHQAFPYVYAPSAGLPNSSISLGVNTDVLADMDEAEISLLEKCVTAHNGQVRTQAAYLNAKAYAEISQDITIATSAPAFWDAQVAAAEGVIKDIEVLDEKRLKAVEAYIYFLKDVAGWSDIGEASYFASRKRVLSDVL